MKKVFIYFFAFLFICFILPAILTKSEISTSSKASNEEENTDESVEKVSEAYIYKQYGMIRLLHTNTNEVEEVDLDTYLCNVVSAEMPVDFEKEALKAQAIVARTYTIYKINNKKHDNANICDDSTCCQAWISREDRLARWDGDKEAKWNKIEECVKETQGKIITYNNVPINAFFHSNSGGKTELPVDVWGGR